MTMDIIAGIIFTVVFFFVFYGPWQWICTDYARQYMFEQRDAIFDLAVENSISFESDEYRKIRKSIESGIRFAHELTFPRFVYTIIFLGLRKRDANTSDLIRAVSLIEDKDCRLEIGRRVRNTMKALLVMTALKSFLFWLLLPIFILVVLNVWLFISMRPWLMRILFVICGLIQIEAERSSSEQAAA